MKHSIDINITLNYILAYAAVVFFYCPLLLSIGKAYDSHITSHSTS